MPIRTRYSITLYRLALLATALAFVVVILGAFTRLSHAGLGCPDWPGCYGHLTWPTTADAVAAAEARFPESPVQSDKTWPEMVHRYFAGSLGLLIIAIAIISWRRTEPQHDYHYPRKHALALIALVVVQALFGMWTVTLKLWPQVVTAHLLGGFATLSLLWLLAQRCSGYRWQLATEKIAQLPKLKLAAIMALIAVITQVAFGGWTSANYAAMACVDFPTCHAQWWPAMDFQRGFNFSQHIGPNYLGGLLENEARTAIHMTHRIGALVVSSSVAILCWRLFRLQEPGGRRIAVILLAVLALQICLGISNVLGSLPLPVAVAHNAVGAMLLLTVVTVNHRIFSAQYAQSAAPIRAHNYPQRRFSTRVA